MASMAPQRNLKDTFNNMVRNVRSRPTTPVRAPSTSSLAASQTNAESATAAPGATRQEGGMRCFFKAHWGKFALMAVILIVVTIMIVRMKLLSNKAGTKKTPNPASCSAPTVSGTGAKKKQVDTEWEQYFAGPPSSSQVPPPLAQLPLPLPSPPHPVQNLNQNQNQNQHQHQHQNQNQNQNLGGQAQSYAPPAPSRVANNQNHNRMPPSDTGHGTPGSDMRMLPEATRPERNTGAAGSSIPVADIPVTGIKGEEHAPNVETESTQPHPSMEQQAAQQVKGGSGFTELK
jgi:hypothetical protein